MDKKTFIRELERSLSVLQEDELRDIVGEYEQHIDMKVQSGLTEEEAIADFGSLAELSGEILEAYHVRADYAAESEREKKDRQKADREKAGREMLEQTGEICARTGLRTMQGLKQMGAWMWGVLLFWKAQAVRPFAWARRRLADYREERHERQESMAEREAVQEPVTVQEPMTGSEQAGGSGTAAHRRKGLVKSGADSLWGLIVGTWHFCRKAAGWCFRAAWNVCWVGFAAFCGVMGLFCLFGLGTLVVLLTQGYPLAGVTIGCLGLNLCLFAAAGFGLTLLWRKDKMPERQEEIKHA